MNIFSFAGKKQAGKDLCGIICQYLLDKDSNNYTHNVSLEDFEDWARNLHFRTCRWRIVKYADKLKDMVCTLLSCTRAQLEDDEFKNTPLGPEWDKYEVITMSGETLYFESERDIVDYSEKYDDVYSDRLVKMTPRLLLQVLGTDCGRNIIHPNIWVNATMRDYEARNIRGSEYWHDKTYWIITDTRFPNEIEAVKERGGLNFQVIRPSIKRIDEHLSETALDGYDGFDEVIINEGTREDLIFKLKDILIKYELIK